MLSKTPVHLFSGSNVALGTAAGKLFRVGTLTIVECVSLFASSAVDKRLETDLALFPCSPGDSDILSVAGSA